MPTQNHTYRLAALYPLHPKPYTLKNFTFSAKERDVETGLSYFGSRYYSSDLSIWLSVDPQAAKYPGLSPFTYCANNPVKLVDPNGEWPEDRARRFMKRHDNTKLFYEKDGSYSVQYTNHRDKGVVIRLKQFKMNFFEKIISRIQTPTEKLKKHHTHRGGIWGVTKDPSSYPPGQDEVTDNNVNMVDLDALQQFSVPQSHSQNEFVPMNHNTNENDDNNVESKETSGEFVSFYGKKQKNGAVAYKTKYQGSADSSQKRAQIEAKGDKVGIINIDQ